MLEANNAVRGQFNVFHGMVRSFQDECFCETSTRVWFGAIMLKEQSQCVGRVGKILTQPHLTER